MTRAKRLYMDQEESTFWRDMIDKYLKPLDEDKEQKKKAQEELKELKNSVSLGFVLINVMWVTAIFMLQANTEVLGMKWPLGAKGPILTFDTENIEMAHLVYLEYEYLRLEPVGLVFVLAFVFIIALQLIGMLSHRILTLGHIVASTHLSEKKDHLKHVVDMIKDFQQNLEPDSSGQTMEERTINEIKTMGDNTLRRMSNTDTGRKLMRTETRRAMQRGVNEFDQRRQTVRNRRGVSSRPNNYSVIKEDDETNHIPVVQEAHENQQV